MSDWDISDAYDQWDQDNPPGSPGSGTPSPSGGILSGLGKATGLLGSLIPGLGAISSIASVFGGLFGGDPAKQAELERQKYLSQMTQQANQNYADESGQNAQHLMSAAGQGGDAIRALGLNLGSSLAQQGGYGSTGVSWGHGERGPRTAGQSRLLSRATLQRRPQPSGPGSPAGQSGRTRSGAE